VKEFITAVDDVENEEAEDKAVIFKHTSKIAPEGFECVFYEPSEGQFLMMLAMGGRHMKEDSIGHFIQLFIELGDDDTQSYFRDLMFDRKSGFKIKAKGGIFDIWEYLVGEWSGKASEKLSDSPKPVRSTTRVSTARSRRSISSASPSAES
jgi:hypothetical protein